MHVLIIPSYYPTSYNSVNGIYLKVQVEELLNHNLQLGVIAPVVIYHNLILKAKKLDFGLKTDKNPPTYTYQYPSFPIFKIFNIWIRLWVGKWLFKKYCKKYGFPDLIHLHSFESGELARWIKRKYNIPFVTTEHSSGLISDVYKKWQLKNALKTYRESELNIVVGTALQNKLQQSWGISSIVIPNLINTSFFKIKHEIEKKYAFISIGSLRDVKNYELLIKSFKSFYHSYPNTNLIIVGDGPQKSFLENLILQLDLSEHVKLIGKKEPEELINLLNSCRIFVSTSKIETFGVAIIEAMSCGLPVVATKCGGPEEIITKESLGVLCDQTEADVVEKMKHVYENLADFEPLKIRQHIIDHYSSEIVCSKIINSYNQIVSLNQ